MDYLGFTQPISALIIGGRGGVGEAMAKLIRQQLPASQVLQTSRDADWVAEEPETRLCLELRSEEKIVQLAQILRDRAFSPEFVFNASGLLHTEALAPERSLRELKQSNMQEIFAVNTFAVGLLLQQLIPLMPRKERSVFASLSARVGSIEDCRLGGWYSYRASKAAQNMFIRCAAIEAARAHPALSCVALHPGTVSSSLSAPFTKRKPADSLFTPQKSAAYLAEVIATLSAEQSGQFFAWDGQAIPW